MTHAGNIRTGAPLSWYNGNEFTLTWGKGTQIASAKKGLFVACGEGVLEIIEMQAPNAKRMAAKAYLMGKRIYAGTMLGKEDR